jgi:hypothetical protein
MYLMDGLRLVVFILDLTQSASEGTLTDNCLKEMSANAAEEESVSPITKVSNFRR